MGVSENSGTPKSSMLIGFSIINHPFWGTPILETPIYIQNSDPVLLERLIFMAFRCGNSCKLGKLSTGVSRFWKTPEFCYHPFIDFPQEWSGQLTKNSRLGFFGVGMGLGFHFFLPHSWILLTCSPFYSTPFSHLAPRKVVPDDEGKSVFAFWVARFWLTNTGRWLGGGWWSNIGRLLPSQVATVRI